MADKNNVGSWDIDPANNTDIAGIPLGEGATYPSHVNNAMRALMAQIKAFFKSSEFRLRDGTDQTKLLAFSLAGLTTATTRTLTVPDKSFIIGNAPQTVSTSTEDLNDLTTLGWHDKLIRGDQAHAWGGSSYGYLLIMAHSTTRTQVVFPYDTSGAPLRVRTLFAGVWSSWREVAEGGDSLKWTTRAIGELFAVDDTLTGREFPPANNPAYRYVFLGAGSSGVGGYNNGILTNETVSGSAPLVTATAKINLAGSPMDGVIINLINTERRFLRAGSPGVVENDQMQRILGSSANGMVRSGATKSGMFAYSGGSNVRSLGTGTGVEDDVTQTWDSALSVGARTGTETRSKSIGINYYMRIK